MVAGGMLLENIEREPSEIPDPEELGVVVDITLPVINSPQQLRADAAGSDTMSENRLTENPIATPEEQPHHQKNKALKQGGLIAKLKKNSITHLLQLTHIYISLLLTVITI